MSGWSDWLLSTFPYLLVAGLAAALLADDIAWVHTLTTWARALP